MLKDFPARRYSVMFEAGTPLALPPYKGSTLRGAFGHAFKGVACALRRQDCGGCLLRERCAYIRVFETPVREEERARGITTHAPHPFVLEPPLEDRTAYAPGETLEFGLVLIGRAMELLPYFIYALERMGERGMGKGRGQARLKEIQDGGVTIYDGKSGIPREIECSSSHPSGEGWACPEPLDEAQDKLCRRGGGDELPSPLAGEGWGGGERVALHFLTPLRLKVRNRYTDSPTFVDMVEHLVARVKALARYHASGVNGLDETTALTAARQVRVTTTDLRWFDWERYSARQETRMKLGGVVGKMEVEGVSETLWPWLRLGEIIHVGKGTSFGLGRYGLKEWRGDVR